MTTPDRRRYERAPAEIACKCRRDAHTNFAPAQTIDISPAGAALEIVSPRTTKLGDRLALAFDSPEHPISRASKMITARVVRVTPLFNNRQHIAVEFDAIQNTVSTITSHAQRRAA